jgi:hypothetical protein
MSTSEKHLYHLDELPDYKIASGYPDVRGWEVRDLNNRIIGKVRGLLANIDQERVVYLDVEVDDTIIDARHDPYGRPPHKKILEFINDKGENHVIIPIGLAELNEEQEYVYTTTIDHRTFAETKRIQRDTPIAREYEIIILDSYGRRYVDRNETEREETLEESETYQQDAIEEVESRRGIRDQRKGSHADREPDYDMGSEHENTFGRNKGRNDDDFYDRSEFDDAGFRKRKQQKT